MMRTLTPVFSIVIAVLLFFFFISPGYQEIKSIRQDEQKYREAVERYNDFYTKVDAKLQIKRNESPVVVERLNQFIPKDIDTARSIADLEHIALTHNMLFGNVSADTAAVNLVKNKSKNNTGDSTESAELQVADISFDVIGTYEQFQSFLIDLESSLSVYEITKIEFSASDGLFEQFGLTVRTYALPKTN